MKTIDTETLMHRCMGQATIMRRVLVQFQESAEQMLETFDSALQEGRWQDAARAAHSMKGAAASISAESARSVAEQLEQNAKQSNSEVCKTIQSQLRREVERCLMEISGIVRGKE